MESFDKHRNLEVIYVMVYTMNYRRCMEITRLKYLKTEEVRQSNGPGSVVSVVRKQRKQNG